MGADRRHEMVSKSKLGPQWVIDPKCFEPRDFKSEYIRRIGDTAPNFVFQKVMPPDKNKSTGYLDGATLFPPREQFTSEYREKLVADKTAGMPGYQKSVPFKVKEVQIQFQGQANASNRAVIARDVPRARHASGQRAQPALRRPARGGFTEHDASLLQHRARRGR